MYKDVIIVGAGAAGVGMGIVLKKMGIDFLILEKGKIGESFKNWPEGTRFISPSFTGNFFGSPDLNAICPDTSPAYSLNTEHPTGEEYAMYLKDVVDFYELPVIESILVESIQKKGDDFTVKTGKGLYTSKFVIWAGGEYQFPKTKVCEGSELAIHNTKVNSWKDVQGDRIPILGGYESGYDTAIQLAKLGKKSTVFDSENHLMEQRSDSSFALSPYTKDRILRYINYIDIKSNTRVKSIENKDGQFILTSESGDQFEFDAQPILATGFETSLVQVKDFFEWKDGSPEISEVDESTKVSGFFLVGPQVKHKKVIFCFIYKFRQRFGVVAESIAERLGISKEERVLKTIQGYKDKNCYLGDLSCCENECVC